MAVGFLLGVLSVSSPSAGAGQDLTGLVTSCGASSEALVGWCHQAALALEVARGGLATAASLGSEVPGSASTVGYRIRTSPRFSLAGRLGLTRFSMVDVPRSYRLSPGDEGAYIPSLHLSGNLGVLNGFSPLPTVGGVLALDVNASTHRLFLPDGHGFRDGVWGWGVGARLGIIRESFTLPGVSISLARRWTGTATLGELEAGGPFEGEFDLELTSVRGLIGKDILGVGLMAGGGWDRLSGKAGIRARVSPTGLETAATTTDLSSDRFTFFGGGSLTYLILQLSLEVGWSRALDPELPLVPQGTAFPSNKAYFGSLGLRVTF